MDREGRRSLPSLSLSTHTHTRPHTTHVRHLLARALDVVGVAVDEEAARQADGKGGGRRGRRFPVDGLHFCLCFLFLLFSGRRGERRRRAVCVCVGVGGWGACEGWGWARACVRREKKEKETDKRRARAARALSVSLPSRGVSRAAPPAPVAVHPRPFQARVLTGLPGGVVTGRLSGRQPHQLGGGGGQHPPGRPFPLLFSLSLARRAVPPPTRPLAPRAVSGRERGSRPALFRRAAGAVWHAGASAPPPLRRPQSQRTEKKLVRGKSLAPVSSLALSCWGKNVRRERARHTRRG